jgi:hypothetical protein
MHKTHNILLKNVEGACEIEEKTKIMRKKKTIERNKKRKN